ncbi:MAG: germacradienol/geosmin synthase, partial [Actinobacteria bacterium]|nr:germacradienol/geosmin synthase [Actinomycetota bacterium]
MLKPAHGKEATGAWNEREFASMDYALLTSYTHPDAAPPELDLVTDWYVWTFFFDRHVVERYRRSSLNEVKDYLARLSAFMPIDPTVASPVPANSVEFGLADLWPRTVTTVSADWRVRFAMNTQNLLEGYLWELGNIDQNHVPNPIEYVDTRRKVGRAPWSADLMEYATAVEIPSLIAHTRSMRVLKNSFSDGVHLRSDIFSYQPDNDGECRINNCVHAVEKFFECNSQEAAELVNNLLTSRLYQFENSVLSELPL